MFFLLQRSQDYEPPASQRGDLKPSWHRRGGGRCHQSCEVYGLKSGCQSAVTDSVVMNPLLGQRAREHRATSKSSTPKLLNCRHNGPKRTHFLIFKTQIKYFMFLLCLQESVGYAVGRLSVVVVRV